MHINLFSKKDKIIQSIVKENDGLILTYDEEELIEKEGHKIKIMPVWKWVLENG